MLNWSPFLILIGFLALLIGILYLVGIYFSLFWIWPWYDISLHLLAGFFVSLTIFAAWHFFRPLNPKSSKTFYILALSTLSIGVLWEIFENISGLVSVEDKGFIADTIKDLFNDFLGAFFGFLILKRFFPRDIPLEII